MLPLVQITAVRTGCLLSRSFRYTYLKTTQYLQPREAVWRRTTKDTSHLIEFPLPEISDRFADFQVIGDVRVRGHFDLLDAPVENKYDRYLLNSNVAVYGGEHQNATANYDAFAVDYDHVIGHMYDQPVPVERALQKVHSACDPWAHARAGDVICIRPDMSRPGTDSLTDARTLTRHFGGCICNLRLSKMRRQLLSICGLLR